MTRKNTVSAYLNGELQNELNEKELTDITAFTTTNNREDIMREIDIMRKTELYEHTEDNCSSLCKAKEKPKSVHDIKKVDEKLTQFAADLYSRDEESKEMGESALSYQGTLDLVYNMETDKWDDNSLQDEDCNKDTGEKARLRQRSRGHLICVTGGGHIQYFDPIFKSESPSQVFMQVIRLMYLEFKDVAEDQLEDTIQSYILSYDNMCHLDQLKAAREPLPLPAPYDTMWLRIKKIIDRLHLPNHKRGDCRIKYNPDNQLPEGYNTMVAEQTFSWFSRFKKIANSLSQVHHLFFIHRHIKRRNRYTSRMHRAGKTPVLPGVNKRLAEKYA